MSRFFLSKIKYYLQSKGLLHCTIDAAERTVRVTDFWVTCRQSRREWLISCFAWFSSERLTPCPRFNAAFKFRSWHYKTPPYRRQKRVHIPDCWQEVCHCTTFRQSPPRITCLVFLRQFQLSRKHFPDQKLATLLNYDDAIGVDVLTVGLNEAVRQQAMLSSPSLRRTEFLCVDFVAILPLCLSSNSHSINFHFTAVAIYQSGTKVHSHGHTAQLGGVKAPQRQNGVAVWLGLHSSVPPKYWAC